MYTLYSMQDSGNCYKPRLLMNLLDIPFTNVEVSALDGSTRTAEYIAKNPNGKVPLLELEDGRFIAESNAMLVYLAEGTDYLPADRYLRAKMFEWMFFEQYSHEPAIAVRRSMSVYPERIALATPEKMESLLEAGIKALVVMETQLAKSDFMVGDNPTIADIALYAYTHCAHQGGFPMEKYPAINRWLERISALPGYVGMDHVF